MNNVYVIVIDVDNVRATAAFKKGMEDLDRLWGQLVVYCANKQAIAKEKYDKEKLKYDVDYEAYQLEMKAYRDWSYSMKGSVPNLPMFPYVPPTPRHPIRGYESVKAQLEHMYNVASSAIGPYRMTEHQVEEMIGWENGKTIDGILKTLGEK